MTQNIQQARNGSEYIRIRQIESKRNGNFVKTQVKNSNIMCLLEAQTKTLVERYKDVDNLRTKIRFEACSQKTLHRLHQIHKYIVYIYTYNNENNAI